MHTVYDELSFDLSGCVLRIFAPDGEDPLCTIDLNADCDQIQRFVGVGWDPMEDLQFTKMLEDAAIDHLKSRKFH
jgi:hypothetical protein